MSAALTTGTKVRVKEGVEAPDLPGISIAGWTGTITQASGKKGSRKIFIEWDESTVEAMGKDYIDACEQKQLFHLMACLGENDLEPVE